MAATEEPRNAEADSADVQRQVSQSVTSEVQGFLNTAVVATGKDPDGSWISRWCRLQKGVLEFFSESTMLPEERFATIDLRGATVSEDAEDKFQVKTSDGMTYMFVASSARSKQQWVSFLGVNIDVAHVNAAEPPALEMPLTQDDLLANEVALERLLSRMRAGVDVKSHSYHMKSYQLSFVGAEAITWMMENIPNITTRSDAVAFGQKLMDANFLHHVCFSEPFKDGHFFYRFQEDETPDVLNTKRIWSKPARNACIVSQDLRKRILGLYSEFVNEEGTMINLDAMAASDAFKDFASAVSELQRVDLLDLTKTERMAFFINLYNMLVIHGQVAIGCPTSAFERNKFFSSTKYLVGGHVYSLNDIEHGMLRGNAKPPGSFRRLLREGDPRLVHVIHPIDCRIHFALNCGAKSCPPIKVYNPNNLQYALKVAAEGFCMSELEIKGREVWLSKILSWYKSDFGSTDAEVLTTLAGFLLDGRKDELLALVAGGSFSMKYRPYDWSAMTS